jgi:hypothetical protein
VVTLNIDYLKVKVVQNSLTLIVLSPDQLNLYYLKRKSCSVVTDTSIGFVEHSLVAPVGPTPHENNGLHQRKSLPLPHPLVNPCISSLDRAPVAPSPPASRVPSMVCIKFKGGSFSLLTQSPLEARSPPASHIPSILWHRLQKLSHRQRPWPWPRAPNHGGRAGGHVLPSSFAVLPGSAASPPFSCAAPSLPSPPRLPCCISCPPALLHLLSACQPALHRRITPVYCYHPFFIIVSGIWCHRSTNLQFNS